MYPSLASTVARNQKCLDYSIPFISLFHFPMFWKALNTEEYIAIYAKLNSGRQISFNCVSVFLCNNPDNYLYFYLTPSLPFHKVTSLLIPNTVLQECFITNIPSFRECPSIGLCDGFEEVASGLLILPNWMMVHFGVRVHVGIMCPKPALTSTLDTWTVQQAPSLGAYHISAGNHCNSVLECSGFKIPSAPLIRLASKHNAVFNPDRV